MWKKIPFDLPADQEEVYIRIKYYYGAPFLATWDLASQSFESTENSIIFPAWTVSRWKFQS
jgi:hypothetical protein